MHFSWFAANVWILVLFGFSLIYFPFLPSMFLSSFCCASVTSVILWIGDLNYRISDLEVDNVKELISKKDFETLHSYDQVLSNVPLFCSVKSEVISFCYCDANLLHNVCSLNGRSMRRLCLSALWRVRLISSQPTNMIPALTCGIQGNFILWYLHSDIFLVRVLSFMLFSYLFLLFSKCILIKKCETAYDTS